MNFWRSRGKSGLIWRQSMSNHRSSRNKVFLDFLKPWLHWNCFWWDLW